MMFCLRQKAEPPSSDFYIPEILLKLQKCKTNRNEPNHLRMIASSY
jgi:hypothetical protein